MKGIKVRIMDVTPSHVSYRYLNSNGRARIAKSKFIMDYQKGVLDVQNPILLDK